MPEQLVPLLALTAALFFGGAGNAVRQAVQHVDSQVASMLSILATFGIFVLLMPTWFEADDWRNPAVWVFALNGLIHPVLSRFLAYEANRRIGATVAASFDATSPLFAAAIAVLMLGERVDLLVALGTCLTVLGVAWLYWNPARVPSLMKAALLFATGAALIRAVNNNVSAFGLGLLPNPVMGACISFGVSLLASTVLFAVRTRRGTLGVPPRAGVLWCLAAGSLSGVAVICLNTALWLGDVVIVAPIVSAAPLFTLLIAWS
ncbi:MAG: DMT family transporter, partial [Gammaproteobacteria bacterium]|nr:DMT family transporter [Gammaproteobacteria bacterium]